VEDRVLVGKGNASAGGTLLTCNTLVRHKSKPLTRRSVITKPCIIDHKKHVADKIKRAGATKCKAARMTNNGFTNQCRGHGSSQRYGGPTLNAAVDANHVRNMAIE
jgi:hypothetical protein